MPGRPSELPGLFKIAGAICSFKFAQNMHVYLGVRSNLLRLSEEPCKANAADGTRVGNPAENTMSIIAYSHTPEMGTDLSQQVICAM